MPLRRTVETRSAPLLVLLSQQPKLLVPLLSLLLLIGGLALPVPLALVCFGLLAVFLCWLTYLSWPVLHGQARVVRVLTIALVVIAAGSRLLG